MKRIALFFIWIVCCTFVRAELTTEQAMEIMSTSIGKFVDAKGLSMKLGIKIPIVPTMEFQVFCKDSLLAVAMDGGKIFFKEDRVWEYDQEDNEVEIRALEKDDPKDLILIGTMPKNFELSSIKAIDKKSFHMGKGTVRFEEKGDKVIYTTKAEAGSLEVQVDKKKKDLCQLKVKKGLVSMTVTYSNLKYTCSDAEVMFDAANYPGVKIKDLTTSKSH